MQVNDAFSYRDTLEHSLDCVHPQGIKFRKEILAQDILNVSQVFLVKQTARVLMHHKCNDRLSSTWPGTLEPRHQVFMFQL